MEQNRALVEVLFADGSIMNSWLSWELHDSYIDPVGSFSFEVAPPAARRGEYREKLVKGQPVTLKIGGNQQGKFLITTVRQSIGDEGYELSVDCKGLLCIAQEASVDPYIAQHFQADTPVIKVILLALKPFGFTDVLVNTADNIGIISGKGAPGRAAPVELDALTHRDVATQQSETALGFVLRLLNRLGLSLRLSSNGILLIGAPDYQQGASYGVYAGPPGRPGVDYMLRRPAIEIIDTNDGQFSEVIVAGNSPDRRGRTTAAQPRGGVYFEDIGRPAEAPFSAATLRELTRGRDGYLGPWKPKYWLDKKARDIKVCTNFAELMHGLRSARAFTVRHSVDGFRSHSGTRIWAPDTVGRVTIEECGIDEDMWLLERRMRLDRRNGQTTALTWIPKGALRLGEA